jgi:hypothetical protein
MIVEHKPLVIVQSKLDFQGNMMSQIGFPVGKCMAKRKKTKREISLAETDSVVPWDQMVKLIEPLHPMSTVGGPAYLLLKIIRVYCMQQRCGLSDPAMEEAFYRRQSQAPLSNYQDQARSYQRQVQALGEEPCSAGYALCPYQSAHGEATIYSHRTGAYRERENGIS